MKHLIPICIIFISISFVPLALSEVVCSEEVLARELREDIEDNGKLDCLREIRDKNGNIINSPAAWDSDCSFESDSKTLHWKNRLIKNYGLTKGLVDVDGNPVEEDFEDQADMCEIIRTLVGNGKFPELGTDVNHISTRIVDYINCPGGDGQTRVCAVTGRSFADKDSWYIFLDGQAISFNGKPKYKLDD